MSSVLRRSPQLTTTPSLSKSTSRRSARCSFRVYEKTVRFVKTGSSNSSESTFRRTYR